MGVERRHHALAIIPLGKRPGTHCTGGWLGLGTSLDMYRKSYSHQGWNLVLSRPCYLSCQQINYCCCYNRWTGTNVRVKTWKHYHTALPGVISKTFRYSTFLVFGSHNLILRFTPPKIILLHYKILQYFYLLCDTVFSLTIQTFPETNPASWKMGTRSLSQRWSSWSVVLTTHSI
jgi:hypothetical protein